MTPRRRADPGAWNDLFAEPMDRSGPQPPPVRELQPDEEAPGESPLSALSIEALNETMRLVIEGAFIPLWVRGEVCDFKAHRNGHWYFALRDNRSQIRCVVWNRDQHRFPAAPDDGMQVVALGQPTVYTARGDLQLTVRAIEAEGDGLRRKAFEQARARLERDGLLDPARRRELPPAPRRIAVITSPSGAALHDIVAVIRRRAPSMEVVVIPAQVQGKSAPSELIAALDRLARWGEADLLIIGRGGGANEDLAAFNNERVARAVAACAIPTISAVGHEVDVTLCDLVADLRAPTPSAAAESAVPDIRQLRASLRAARAAMRMALQRSVMQRRRRVKAATASLRDHVTLAITTRRSVLAEHGARLHALSPLSTLSRGYAVARDADGRALKRAAAFTPGATFDLLLSDGTVNATTNSVQPDRAGDGR